ncbi:MAG: tetratricopeptide repeat protein [Nitrospinae bacterium]|nr:tetratricopeptide repeat protein [Nitrospinota bacterium]
MGRIVRMLTAPLLACAFLACATTGETRLAEIDAMASSAYTQGDMEQAERHYRQLVAAPGAGFEAWFRLGNILARANRVDEAVKMYEKTLELRADFAPAWRNLAVLRLRQGLAALLESQARLDTGDPLYADNQAIIEALRRAPAFGAAGDNL